MNLLNGVEEKVVNSKRVACGRKWGRVRTYSTKRWLCDAKQVAGGGPLVLRA